MSIDIPAAIAYVRAQVATLAAERATLTASIDELHTKLESHQKHAPKRPAHDRDAIDRLLREKEHRQSTTTLSKAAEAALDREMKELKRERAGLPEWAAHEEAETTMRATLRDAKSRRTAVSTQLIELRSGVRTLEALELARAASAPGSAPISPDDIIVVDIPCASELVPRLVGRARSALTELETLTGTACDILDAEGGGGGSRGGAATTATGGGGGGAAGLRVRGTPAGIALVRERLASLAAQVEATMTVSHLLLSCLRSSKGSHIRDLEQTLDVKIQLPERAQEGAPAATAAAAAAAAGTSSLVARGMPSALNALKTVLARAEGLTVTVPIDARTVPIIIGRGGSNVKRVRDCGVEVESIKPPGPPGFRILALGPGADECIRTAVALVHTLVEELGTVEMEIPICRDMFPWLLAKGGVGSGGNTSSPPLTRIQEFQKATGLVSVYILREGEVSPELAHKLGAEGTAISLRGTNAALLLAKASFESLVQEYARCNLIFRLPLHAPRVLMGPGYATILAIRAATGALVEVDEATGAPPPAAAVVATSEAPSAVSSSGAAASGAAAKGAVGAGGGAKGGVPAAAVAGGVADATGKAAKTAPPVRVNRADEAGLPAGEGIVVIRGDADKVQAALARVQAAVADVTLVEVTLPPNVMTMLRRESAKALRALEETTGACFTLSRGAGTPLTTTILGSAAAVKAGQAALSDLIASQGLVQIDLPAPGGVVGELVGKGGSVIKALRESTGAEVDIGKTSGTGEDATVPVIISGSTAAVEAAATQVRALAAKYASENAVLPMENAVLMALKSRSADKLKAISAETGVELFIDHQRDDIRFKGPNPDRIASAVAAIRALARLDAPGVEVFPLDVSMMGRAIGKGGANLKRIEDEHGVCVIVDPAASKLTIRGEVAAVAAAAAELSLVTSAGVHEAELHVPSSAVRALIGAKGARLKSTIAETGAFIEIPPAPVEGTPVPPFVPIRIKGPTPATVEIARTVLSAQIDGHPYRFLQRPADLLHAAPVLAAFTSAATTTSGKALVIASASPSAPVMRFLITAKSDAALSRTVWAMDTSLSRSITPSSRSGATSFSTILVSLLVIGELERESSSSSSPVPPPPDAGDVTPSLSAALQSSGLMGYSPERTGDGSGYIAVWGSLAAIASGSAAIASAEALMASRCAEIPLDGWLIPSIVGKGGASITTLLKRLPPGTNLNVERGGMTSGGGSPIEGGAFIRLSARSSDSLTAAVAIVRQEILRLASLRVILTIPVAAISPLIGKSGATLKSFQDELGPGGGMDIDRDRRTVTLRASSASAIATVKAHVLEFLSDVCGSTEGCVELTDAQFSQLSATLVAGDLGFASHSALLEALTPTGLISTDGPGRPNSSASSTFRVLPSRDGVGLTVKAATHEGVLQGVREVVHPPLVGMRMPLHLLRVWHQQQVYL